MDATLRRSPYVTNKGNASVLTLTPNAESGAALRLSFPGKGDHRTASSGLAQPRHASWLVLVRPVPGQTALGAAIGVGVVLPPDLGRDPSGGRRLAGNARRRATRKGKQQAEIVRHCRAHAGVGMGTARFPTPCDQ